MLGLQRGSGTKVCLPLIKKEKKKKNLTKSPSNPLLQYFKSCWLNSKLHETGEILFSLLQYLLQGKERKKEKKKQSQFFQYQAAVPGPPGPHLE